MRFAIAPRSLLPLIASLGILGFTRAQETDPPTDPAEATPTTVEESAVAGTDPEPDAEAKPPTDEEIREIISALDSDDFREREAASSRVWQLGRATEKQLRKMVEEATSAEMRYRGGKILSEFDLGVYPDTPERVRDLLRSYRKGDQRQRAFAVQQLADLGQTELLAKLVRRERDPEMRQTIADVLADGVERLAPIHIAEGNYEKAGDLLNVAALLPQGMKNYVAFLARTGGLSDAITKQRKRAGTSPVDTELLAWMLRMDGQFEEAAKIFTAVDDEVATRATLAAGGDPLAYAEANIDPTKSDINVLGYQLAAARLQGDDDAVDRHLEAIERYATAIPDQSIQCFTVLILNGFAPRAIELARELEHDDLPQLALAQYDFKDAMKALGADRTAAPYSGWLKKFAAEFKIEREQEIPDAIQPAVTLAAACIETGQTAEAVRILSEVSRLLERTGDSQLKVVTAAAGLELWDFAIEMAVKSMELETEFASVEALYSIGGSVAAMRDTVWEHLRDTKPDQSSAAALRELGALLRYTGLGDADPTPVIKSLRKAAVDAPAEEKATILLTAADLARVHSKHDTAIEVYSEAMTEIGPDLRPDHRSNFGFALFGAERYREAAEQFAKASELDGSNAVQVYLRGLSLDRAGDKEEAEALRKRSALMALGNTYDLNVLAGYAYENGDTDLSSDLDNSIIRLARPDDLAEGRNYRFALGRTATTHLGKREFAAAATTTELYNLALLRAQYYTASSAMSRYMAWAKVKARALLDAGKTDEAIVVIDKALATVPSDSSMLEDTYQLLADKGDAAAADKFFDIVYPRSKNAAETFPDYGQYHNNLAWLLSRCGKKLDEALASANRALELEPENGAFLDTLAEVHFQRGEREEAIASSEKAVAILGDDPQLLHQLERFRNGKPSDR